MIKNLYSIYDCKAKVYFPLTAFNTDGEATRAFSDGLNDDNSSLSKHPEDFSFFQMGTFDDNSGKITGLVQPKLLYTGLQIIDLKNNMKG